MTPRKLRFGMIGTGNFAPWFARYINEVAELVAICDPNPKARAAFAEISGLHLPEFDDYDAMLAGVDIDAVVITGPNFLHKPATLAAAKAGKHVFCEKAMAPNVADCWEMVRACETAGVRLMVGHKRRLRPPWARMIELTKEVGPVASMSITNYHESRNEFGGWWAKEELSGGLLMLSGVHEIDWMRAMCGDVQSISAIAGPQIEPHYEFSDSIQVLLRFASGAVGSLGVSLCNPLWHYRETCGGDVVTSYGGLRLISSKEGADVYWQRTADKERHHEHFKAEHGDPVGVDEAFHKEMADFVAWVNDGTTPCLTWREGLRTVEVAEAARLSAAQGGVVMQLPLYPELEL